MAMFITLEGIEGSGKTTQAGYMVDFLEKVTLDARLNQKAIDKCRNAIDK